MTAPAPEPRDRTGPPEPIFLDGRAGPLFAIYHAPAPTLARAGRSAVLYLPPFAEEMNRARRMAALLGRRLAQSGVGCLVLDPFGTGDSAGDVAEARWDLWRDDADVALGWLRARGHGEITVLGLRLGACLALQVAGLPESGVKQTILWNPVLRGEMFLTQFLRIRTAAGISGGAGGETTKDLRARLRGGETLEIAGYDLAPALAEAMSALDLVTLGEACPASIRWFELGGTEPASLPPAAAKAAERLSESGADLTVTCLPGEPFWSIEETVVVPDLLAATAALWRP